MAANLEYQRSFAIPMQIPTRNNRRIRRAGSTVAQKYRLDLARGQDADMAPLIALSPAGDLSMKVVARWRSPFG